MAVGLPLKTTYVNGDVYSASDVNDTNGTINANASPYAAGKNKIINGDFRFNQRAFTSNTTTNTYNFDRFAQFNSGTSGTLTSTPQVFTPGAAPVAGYEGTNFLQGVTAAGADTNTAAGFYQRIESVRTFANQAVTISFYAKATSGTPKIGVEVTQNFGSGGSPSADTNTAAGAVTLSTSFARYSVTLTVPSISGKTIGTSNDGFLQTTFWLSAGSTLNTRASSIGLQNNTFQIWGVQVENGSTATFFQTATGTIQGELAACQRYFERYSADAAANAAAPFAFGMSNTTTNFAAQLRPYTTKRTSPTITFSANTDFRLYDFTNVYTTTTMGTAGSSKIDVQGVGVVTISAVVASGLTAFRPYMLIPVGPSGNRFIDISAEL